MTPDERELFEEGFVSTYLKNVEGSPDNANLVNRLMNSPRDRKMFDLALGQDKAKQLEAFLHVENVMQAANNAMGNSTTARQLVELGLAGGGGLAVSGGNPFAPEAILTAAILKWAPGKINNAIKEKAALNIARLLMSPDPKLKQQAVKQLAKPEYTQALRKLTQALTGAGAAAGANVAAQQTPLTGSQMGQGIREGEQ